MRIKAMVQVFHEHKSMRIRREIIFFPIAVIIVLSVIWFFFGNIENKKKTIQTDLYALTAPNPYAILAINRPVSFTKHMLASKPVYDAFTGKIPDIYLSLLSENKEQSTTLLSFHPQGIVYYSKTNTPVGNKIPEKFFNSFAPQMQTKGDITFSYYPDTGNQFFGCFQYHNIYVASYSKKLLEEAADILASSPHTLSARQKQLRKTFDPNAPLNLMINSDSLDLYVKTGNTTEWRINDYWLGADIFMSEGNICCFGSVPYFQTSDSLYQALADTLTLRIEQIFPQFHIQNQINIEGENVYYTGCNR